MSSLSQEYSNISHSIFLNFWQALQSNPLYSTKIAQAKLLTSWQKYPSAFLQQNSKAIQFRKNKLTVAITDNRLLLKFNQNKILFLKWYKKNYPKYEITDIIFKYIPKEKEKIAFQEQTTEKLDLFAKLNNREKEERKILLKEKKDILNKLTIKEKINYLKKSYFYYSHLTQKYGSNYPQSQETHLETKDYPFAIPKQYPSTGLSSSFLGNNDNLQLHELLNSE